MTSLEFILPAIDKITKQNDLILKALEKPTPLYKDFLPALYALIGAGVGASVAFFGQWRIFKLTERKELKKDIRKLYSEFCFYSKEYSVSFFDFNYNLTQGEVLLALRNKYITLTPQASTVKEKAQYEYSIKTIGETLDHITVVADENKKRYRELKYNALKALFEISLIAGTSKLDDLIEEIEVIDLYREDFTKAQLNTLQDKDYPDKVAHEKIYPLKEKIDKIISKIQKEIKAIKA